MSDALNEALATVHEDVANGRLSPAVGTALDELARRTDPDADADPEHDPSTEEN